MATAAGDGASAVSEADCSLQQQVAIKIPALEGPDEYHLCLITEHSLQKFEVEIQEICQALRSKAYLTHTYENDHSKLSAKENVQLGIRISRKLALVLSKDFVESESFKAHVEWALRKSRIRGNAAVIVILMGIQGPDVPADIRHFKGLVYGSDTFMSDLCNLLNEGSVMDVKNTPVDQLGGGAYMAWSFFLGYLKLASPSIDQKLMKSGYVRNRRNVPKKFFTILPESCFSKPSMHDGNKAFEAFSWIYCYATRAGNKDRCYKTPVYKIYDEQTQMEYFAACEYCTSTLAFWEMKEATLCSLTEEQMKEQMVVFYHTLQAIISHPDHKKFNNIIRLLYYKDARPDPEPLEDFVRRHIRYEIKQDLLQEEKQSEETQVMKMETLSIGDSGVPEVNQTTILIPTDEVHPMVRQAEMDRQVDDYKLERNPQDGKIGFALIISNEHFDTAGRREGTQIDADILRMLFEDLGYNVEVKCDLKAAEMHEALEHYRLIDHEDYSAFVCCILTHGSMGTVLGTDSEDLQIIELTAMFSDTRCPSLEGKPKQFYIQACQGLGCERGRVAQGSAPAESSIEPDSDPFADPKSGHVPKDLDFIMSYSTLPGSVSYRHTQEGSFYVRALAATFRRNNGWNIDPALKKVTEMVKDETYEALGHRMTRPQWPFYCSTGCKNLKLKF